jgi:hypothetical protein
LATYFADIAAVLEQLLPRMAPGARAAWVIGDSAPYGVRVDTPGLLGFLAEEIGFEILDDVHLRDRGQRWPGVGKRHRLALTERVVVFRRPREFVQARLPGMES